MIILASASPRRKALLSGLGLTFAVRPTDSDERCDVMDPEQHCLSVANRKVEAAVKCAAEDDYVIAADTVVYHNGRVLGKPRDDDEARAMLHELSGDTHTVYTGLVVSKGRRRLRRCERTEVTFVRLSDKQIESYVHSGEPRDKAGAYGIQGKGAVFVKGICGDYYNVMGLPLCTLWQMLEELA